METLMLNYNQAIKDELLKVLGKFSKKDLEIVEEESSFDQVREELHAEYKAYKNGETKLQSIDNFEKEMNDLFPKK